MKIDNILKSASYFYSLAVPLTGILDIPEARVTDFKRYEDHYSPSGFNFRVINIDRNFMNKYIVPAGVERTETVENFKKKIEDAIANKRDGKDYENLKWLNDAVDLKSINVVAFKMDESDMAGPEALTHDIGHNIFNYNVKADVAFKKFIKAFFEDYKFIYQGEDVTNKVSLYESLHKNLAEIVDFLCYLLLVNSSLPEKVSDINTKSKQGIVIDLIADIAADYVASGDSLKHLTPSPESAYAYAERDSSGNFILSGEFFLNNPEASSIVTKKSIVLLELIPKDSSLPKLNEKVGDVINLFEKTLSKYFSELTGKVFLLWSGIEI